MDKFVTRKARKGDADVHTSLECGFDCAVQPPEKIAVTSRTSTNNKPNYKKNLTYDASWKKYSWMSYNSTLKGMVCTVCRVCGKVTVQVKGAWVTRPVNNWAAVNAAGEHAEVERVLGTLLTIWKAFYYSPKKAEKLKETQAEFQSPEVKMQKPSDTRWLARERFVHAVRLSLPALVSTFEEIYDETGDAEAHGIAILLTKYKTVACIYMLCDVLHTVAAL